MIDTLQWLLQIEGGSSGGLLRDPPRRPRSGIEALKQTRGSSLAPTQKERAATGSLFFVSARSA